MVFGTIRHGRAAALVAASLIVAIGAVAVAGAAGGAASHLAKASFVKVKCPGKTAKGKKVTCKVKGELPQGPRGPQGEQGPTGADGVSGYETIRQTFPTVFVPRDDNTRGLSEFQVVSCPAGKRAIGGGANLGTNAGQAGNQRQVLISASVPTTAGDGWQVQLFNNTNLDTSIDLEVTAICARG